MEVVTDFRNEATFFLGGGGGDSRSVLQCHLSFSFTIQKL